MFLEGYVLCLVFCLSLNFPNQKHVLVASKARKSKAENLLSSTLYFFVIIDLFFYSNVYANSKINKNTYKSPDYNILFSQWEIKML